MLARLGVIALVFGLTFPSELQAQENKTDPEIQPEATHEQPAVEPAPVESPVSTPANETRTEHKQDIPADRNKEPYDYPRTNVGDGWAQWAMVVLSFFTLCVSVCAVLLLKNTLKATRDAVRSADDAVGVTRDIGEKQIRACLSVVDGGITTIDKTQTSCGFFITAKNSGQSPAFNVSTHYKFSTKFDEAGAIGKLSNVDLPIQDIPANQSIKTLPVSIFFREYSCGDANFALTITITIKWQDVFGCSHSYREVAILAGNLNANGVNAIFELAPMIRKWGEKKESDS